MRAPWSPARARAASRALSEAHRLGWRVGAGAGAVLLLVGWLGWTWYDSRVASAYSVMDMGVVDLGGGSASASHAGHGGHGGHAVPMRATSSQTVAVDTLTGPATGEPDAAFTLAARRGRATLATGETVDGYTLNGSSPGPEIRVRQGDLVQVTLENVDVADGVTLHWHGLDVPNAEDGVAGVTQDAVPPGGRHVYRFVAEDAGTYWYHSHQVSHEQVRKGLFGALVVEPADPVADAGEASSDVVALVHTYGGLRTVSGRTGAWSVAAGPGEVRRVRLVNTDNGPLQAWVGGAAFRVLAVDGVDLSGPTPVREELLVVPAGGRLDLEIAPPADGTAARVELGGGTALLLGPEGSTAAAAPRPRTRLDLLAYGTPADLPFDATRADRSFDYDIGRRPGFVDGRPGFWWTINGRLFPDVPMYMVREGDVVRMTIRNDSGDVHPMHLHGHHAVVLSRDGAAATGSPVWVDSLNVEDGETVEIAFLADNPGVWMDHCHNLAHAAEGLVAHLMYDGVSTPYRIGSSRRGGPANAPE